MKLRNLIPGIALIAITATIDGQSSPLMEKLFHGKSNEGLFKTAEYQYGTGQLKAIFDQFLTRETDISPSNDLTGPVVLKSYKVDRVDISYSEDLKTEEWMTTPFENKEVVLTESWMTTPFENKEVVLTESWMTTPFDLVEMVKLEGWMSYPFDPVEMLVLEEWMTTCWK
jgi:hypothetical protein